MISDYEDDDHFCIKCHVTIGGLENYIQHRKANCGKTMVVAPKSPLPSQLLVLDESFGLKADDFFSSLELQSSNKKQPMPSTSGKTFSGILTRSKTSAVIHASTSTTSSTSPATSSTHHQLREREVDVQQSKSGKHAWIGGHQLKELGTGDNQTKLIKAVDNLSRTACLKKYEPPTEAPLVVTGYNDASDEESDEYDYDDDEDDDEEVPRHHTGGKWMPEWNLTIPPINHTGGKWRPSKTPVNQNPQKWKQSFHDLVPSPNYTKGKWKPEQFPPPHHTKGKWRPPALSALDTPKDQDEEPKQKKRAIEEILPFRKSNGSDQYWCTPCNRLLSSKIVYERHLRSELHFKRTLHDTEFDDTVVASTSTSKSTHLNTNRDKEAKRTIRKPVEYWSQSHTGGAPTSENNKDPTNKNTTDVVESPTTNAPPITMTMKTNAAMPANQQRFRRKIYVKCQVCLARVTSQMMGKHLISHYHCRKGDITKPAAQQMVLDNIHAVVLQSPYQCSTCKFYCNTHDYFLRHWRTTEHLAQVATKGGLLTCTFCKFSCTNQQNQIMHQHLMSPEHYEVISVINRSVPIIIKNIKLIKCGTCQASFTFNMQLRQHCRRLNHELPKTSTDEYQKIKHCHLCTKSFNSLITLQRHLKTHNTSMFFCGHCNLQFDTLEQIIAHRNMNQHKNKNQKTKEPTQTKCNQYPKPKTQETFENIQDLRTNTSHKCDQCMFSCVTISELLFHQALHGEALRTLQSKQPHYKCSLCDKFFPKSSLRYHIQNHTNEKLYKCSICDARFARKNNWLYHFKKHAKKDHIRQRSSLQAGTKDKRKNSLCSTCGAKFANNQTLKKHMVLHTGKPFKCEHPGCIHMARTPADLRVHHRGTHSTEMSFRCDRCDYRGKSKQQLKRHATIHEYVKKYQCSRCSFTCRLAFHLRRHERIHTGSKPFACPHCDYRCNNLENLRKHVLSTNKHPGKCIYECKLCETDNDEEQYSGNFAKDFKVHLLSAHGDVFGSVDEAASYIAGIYDSIEDVASAARAALSQTEPSTSAMSNKINPRMLDDEVDDVAPTSNSTALISPAETFETKTHQQHSEEHQSHEGHEDEDQEQQEELFPMYIIAKDGVYLDKESWCEVGNFDVEESGALVSFNEDPDQGPEPLFQEHFP